MFIIGVFCYPFLLQAQWYPVAVPTAQNLLAITFTDTLHGYVTVGDGSILESSDGGFNWQTVLTGTGIFQTDICFPAASTGYAVGNNGLIIKTVNAGNTWSVINSPTTNVLRGVFFLNPDTGFICGQGESIYRTINGGTTWIQKTAGAYWLRQFSFPTMQTGFCAGDNKLIYKTTNGGLTWNLLPGSGGSNLTDIQFLTVDTGYVCGYGGYMAKSLNGGQTWQVLNTGTTTDFQGLWFFTSHTGYCVGPPGIILKTTDGGTTWAQETSGTSVTLRNLYFFNQNKGFITGFAGTLLENCLPSPGSISGPSPVCQGDTGKIYSVNPVAGATGYFWSVPPGVVITSGNNTNVITVTFTATSVSGSFSVYAFKSNCNGPTSPSFPVIVNPVTLPAISGPVSSCVNAPGNVYSTQAGMTDYIWSISSGGTVTGGGTTSDNTITVTWNTAGSQSVSVNFTNTDGCAAASPAVYTVTVNALPAPALSGPTPLCVNSTGNIYTTEAGMTNYLWTISGGIITSGGTTTSNTAIITWNTAGIQSISVNYSDTNGCTAASATVFPVTVNPLPSPSITGPSQVCVNSTGNVYSTRSGMSNYTWFVSPGGTITSGGTITDSTVTITWNMTGAQMVSVNYSDPNNCRTPFPSNYSVLVDPLPPSAGKITGITPVCAGAQGVAFSVAELPGVSSYVWTTPMGVDIVSGQNTDSIIVNFTASASSGDFTVYGVNSCGNGQASPTFPVTVNHQASISAGPDTSACEGTEITIQQSAAINYTSLLWTTNGQGTMINGTSLNPSYLPSVSDTGDVTLTLTAFSVPPCLNVSSGMIIHYGRHPVVYAGADQAVCSQMPFTVTGAYTLYCSAFSWTNSGQGQLINATTLSPAYIPATGESGAVTLTLHGSGTGSCQWEGVSDQMILLIHPPILIQAKNSDTIPYNTCDTLSILISGGSGNYGYTWEPGPLLLNDTVANPITVNLENDILFTLLLTDKATGCTATDSIRVHLIAPETSENCIVVHNTVTPNGDGFNDHLIIDCIENYPENKVEIFNRWGNRVHIYTNYDNETRFWDGTDESHKPIPDGTYYYVIRIPNVQTFAGWIFVRGGSK